MVLGAEVGGRWSSETSQFLAALAAARSRDVPEIFQGRAKAGYLRRWSAILACCTARAFTISLLDRCPVPAGGDAPSVEEVLRDARFA